MSLPKMMIYIAIGDAYGAGFEYADENLPFNDLTRYIKHPTHGTGAGQYTDDTQMSIGIAEAIIEDLPWTKDALAQKFVDVFHRDRRDGYSRGFQAVLNQVLDGKELLGAVTNNSDKSGGAMRAGPIGFIPDIKKVMEMADLQAQITHNTPDGRAAAVAASLMHHYFLYNLGPKAKLGQFLVDTVKKQVHPGYNDWTQPWAQKIRAQGWMSVRAAVTAINMFDSLSDMLRFVVGLGGDTDTAAAMAMSAGSCSSEVKHDLPDVLVHGIQDPFGITFLSRIDEQLNNKFGFVL